jgi:hypothetical protein
LTTYDSIKKQILRKIVITGIKTFYGPTSLKKIPNMKNLLVYKDEEGISLINLKLGQAFLMKKTNSPDKAQIDSLCLKIFKGQDKKKHVNILAIQHKIYKSNPADP